MRVRGARERSESGQALILALGGALALIIAALVLVAIAGAVTGKGRAQRAADLVAISAVRSMRDDLDRLLAPPRLANGEGNPDHLSKPIFLARARIAALGAARANGVDPKRVLVHFPDADSFAPVRAKAAIVAALRESPGQRVEASAVAEAAAPYGAMASGETGIATARSDGIASAGRRDREYRPVTYLVTGKMREQMGDFCADALERVMNYPIGPT